jgi:hypothetical protein
MSNKTPYARRSKDDPQWQIVKKAVDARDKKQCRFMRCLSLKESHQFIKGSEMTIDRAHIFAASDCPELIYSVTNIASLTRFIHRRMDEYKSPLTGDFVQRNEHFYWWYRILKLSMEAYNSDLDYEYLLKQEIK